LFAPGWRPGAAAPSGERRAAPAPAQPAALAPVASAATGDGSAHLGSPADDGTAGDSAAASPRARAAPAGARTRDGRPLDGTATPPLLLARCAQPSTSGAHAGDGAAPLAAAAAAPKRPMACGDGGEPPAKRPRALPEAAAPAALASAV